MPSDQATSNQLTLQGLAEDAAQSIQAMADYLAATDPASEYRSVRHDALKDTARLGIELVKAYAAGINVPSPVLVSEAAKADVPAVAPKSVLAFPHFGSPEMREDAPL